MTEKTCSRCRQKKNISEFYRAKTNDGLAAYCKQCNREKHIEYRRRNGIQPLRKRLESELPASKVCTRCKSDKPKADFRVRLDKGKYWMINPTCRKCDSEIAAEYYNRNKDKLEFKEKNRKRAKEYTEKNCDQIKERRRDSKYLAKHNEWEKARYVRKKDQIKAKSKEKRKHPEYKKKMREYRQKNKEKIFQQELATKRRYHEKNKKGITDKYVRNQLRQVGNLNPTPEEIEIKRAQILIFRIKEKIDAQKVGVTKVCSVCKEGYDLSQFWRTAKNSKKRVSFCKACGSIKNQEQKNKRNERHSKSAQPPV